MLKAQKHDLVRIECGHHRGMVARVAELSDSYQLARLELTRNDAEHWYWVEHLTVMYRPSMLAA